MTTAPHPSRLLGAHMPTVGGLHNSLTAGAEIGCTAVQLFTSNPRQWKPQVLSPETVVAFKTAQEATGITFTVAHDSYLINLAAPTPEVLEKSKIAFRGELDRAEQLGIPWVVTHMGAHLNQGEDEALDRLVASVKEVLEETDSLGYRAGIALETTAGQGTGLGWRFEHLGRILQGVGPHPRLGVCMDTCHIFAAGYDLRGDQYDVTMGEFDALVGLQNLKVIHVNDCVKPLACRVDRHAHLGQGQIGLNAFFRLATDSRLAHIPMIVETPDSEMMHKVNLARLRTMTTGVLPEIEEPLSPTSDEPESTSE